MNNNQIVEATKITCYTLVGFIGTDFPMKRGNCFSMEIKDTNKEIRIVNFGLENLQELLRRGLTYPIKVKLLTENIGLIHDERISDKWYSDKICTVCCPKSLLPYTQQNEFERQETAGIRKTSGNYVVIDWANAESQL